MRLKIVKHEQKIVKQEQFLANRKCFRGVNGSLLLPANACATNIYAYHTKTMDYKQGKK